MSINSATRNCPNLTEAVILVVLFLSWSPHGAAATETIWVQASDAKTLSGPVVFGKQAGIVEEGVLGDFLVSTVCVTPKKLRGYAEYEIDMPEAGTYYVWARLRNPTRFDASFALIPEGVEPSGHVKHMVGNGGIGLRQWHWDSRGTRSTPGTGKLSLKLPAGKFKFRIYPREASDGVYDPNRWDMARPMFNPRLNLLCLTSDPDYTPNDADARRDLKVEPSCVDIEAIRVKPMNLLAVSDEELKRRGKKRIPDWLRCPRFYTKDTWHEDALKRRPGDIAFMVRQVAANGGNALRLAVYASGEAFYQSKVTPHAQGLGEMDYLREAMDEAKRLEVKIVVYFWRDLLYENHPLYHEAAVRLPNGEENPRTHRRPGAHIVCPNNPKYRKFLKNVVHEIFTEYGPDGFYLDGPTVYYCFCKHCRKKYRDMFGEEMPVEKIARLGGMPFWAMRSEPEPVGDPGDPDIIRYTKFYYQTIIDETRLFHDAVKEAKPDAVTLFHCWPKPDTLSYYDATLTEIYIDRPWRHSLWKFGELANYSNIFPVPVLFNIYLHDAGTLAEAQVKNVQGLANGCYPNQWNLLNMGPVFRVMQENAACFDFLQTSPTRFIALPRTVSMDPVHGAIYRNMTVKPEARGWFLESYVGMYSALVRNSLPVVTHQRSDFHEHLDGYRVLCLANEMAMSDEQVEAVRQFVKRGGGLIATYKTSLYNGTGRRRQDLGLADVFGVHYEKTLPVGPRKVCFDAEHPLTKDLAEIKQADHDDIHVVVTPTTGTCLATLAGKDLEGERVPAVVVNTYGSGRVVYLPGRFDASQCIKLSPTFEQLMAAAVRWVAGGRVPVEIRAPARVGVTLFDQPDRRILHLINLQGDSKCGDYSIQPQENVAVRLELPAGRQVRQLRRLWGRTNVPYVSSGPFISFKLDKLGHYEVVVAELETR